MSVTTPGTPTQLCHHLISLFSRISDLFDHELEGFQGHAGYLYVMAGPVAFLTILHVTLVWVESFI